MLSRICDFCEFRRKKEPQFSYGCKFILVRTVNRVTFWGKTNLIVNDGQKDPSVLAYLFIPNQLYMFRAMYSPIIRST